MNSFSLLTTPWLPVRFKDGTTGKLAPVDLADENVVDIAAPRADLQGAVWQFLLGLLQTSFAPKDHRRWDDIWEDGLEAEKLREALQSLEHAFQFGPDSPSFMQDFEALKGDKVQVASLLPEIPGAQTTKFNKDHFIKRGVTEHVCPHCSALTEDLRLKVVRKMYELRFREPPPARRSVEQLRGIEGSRVRQTYALLAKQYGVKWNGRKYDPKDWEKGDVVNRCISAATSCLYGISEAAVLAAGYAPAIGFIHSGKPLSFVYDIADIIKFDLVVPKAFEIAARQPAEPDKEVRLACRDIFRSSKLTGKLIPLIEEVLAAGEIEPPQPAPDMLPPAIPEPETLGDSGHRGRGG
ncbi:type I-E CRISPR-associated endonuclease Cas1e [Escherichia coli]|nr:type I-E CRISPR-associated endonuclease Cas1e [Escherichia coli]MCI1202669.1 type I-E CRISPR-associated endonuclease Cas1e [Escherichia coli]